MSSSSSSTASDFPTSVTDIIDNQPDEKKPIPWKMIIYGTISVAGIIITAIGALAAAGIFPSVIFHGIIGSASVAGAGGVIALGCAFLTYFQYKSRK